MRTFLLFVLFVSSVSSFAVDFQAGVARKNITPPLPIRLTGYAARTNDATAVRTELWAKALALADDKGGRAVIVTTDLIGLPREISEAVTKRSQLDRSQLLLNSSHTHYGPALRSNLSIMFTLDPAEQERISAYSRKLTDDLVLLIADALADLAPAQLACGHGTAGFAINRREPTKTGFKLGENPDGPTDHDVPVLKVTAPDGRLRAVLFGYACHNTTLSSKFNEVDGDYAGYAQRAIEKTNPGATAMFMMLCGGDQNPRPRGEYANVEAHGQELADVVKRVLAGELRPVRPPIRTAHEAIQIDFAAHTREIFETELAQPNKYRQRRAKLMLAAYDTDHPVRQMPYPIQVLRLGRDLTFLALAGEVVVDYALRVKREFPKENLIVAGYSGEVSCYVPSLRVLREGGYEPVDSTIYYGLPGPFAETVEEEIFRAIRRVISR